MVIYLLVGLGPIKLIANQSACAQAKQSANRRAGPGISHGAADHTVTAPKEPIKSRPAKNEFAIFIILTAFLRRARLVPNPTGAYKS
jgi:hypothetical protein